MECRLATEKEMQDLDKLSRRIGGIPFVQGQSLASVLMDDEKIVGYSAVHNACHAAGSFVEERLRKKGHSYELRSCLDAELRRRGIGVYFALPNNDFEKWLFAKYGHVTESLVQVRHL